MARDSGTRSGMLWEVERLLDECQEKPQILLMENVPDVIGSKNITHFVQWRDKLESLGYKCYWHILNGKDYGIPQNRERCFMVSILGDYYYEFPQPIKLEKRLKDLLEDNVDEKYYLSDTMINYITSDNKKWTGNNDKSIINRNIGVTINTRVGSTRCDCSDYICKDLPDNINLKTVIGNKSQGNRVYDTNGLSVSLCANGGGLGAKTGLYLEPKMSWVDKKVADTIKNNNGEIPEFADLYNARPINNGISGTLSTSCGNDCGCGSFAYINNYRIRKLTPKECFRLMGVKDEDFDKVAKNQSNASLYHLAGDSIIVCVLCSIFKQILQNR